MKPNQTAPISWSAYKAANPKVRIRNAAAELGVSELELLSSDLSDYCVRLNSNILDIVNALPTLGPVMALTRNDAAVHEVTAPFSTLKIKEKTALALRPGQDTRFFTANWKYVFAVNENDRQSLQFFDSKGVAAHKIYLVDNSHVDSYLRIVTQFKDPVQAPVHLGNSQEDAPRYDKINVTALRQRWSSMQNVHQGNQIIKSLNAHKIDAYEALSREFAIKLPSHLIEKALTELSEKEMETMVFVHNENCVQSYAGSVNRLLRTGPWFNVLDPGFNLHLNTELLSQVWIVKKPSKDGYVHSFSAFDQNLNEVLTLTDNRSKGERESTKWAELVDVLQYEVDA